MKSIFWVVEKRYPHYPEWEPISIRHTRWKARFTQSILRREEARLKTFKATFRVVKYQRVGR